MKNVRFGFLLVTLVLAGCVTGTRNIQLTPPEYSSGKSASGLIYIASIEDKRIFEQKPKNPSTPSVKGNLSSASKEKLSTLVGRQRNGWGAAMGDVALPEGQTVQEKVRELLTKGLESRGYEVINDNNAPNKITVDIEKFWAWFSPGMWVISFESDIQCKINLENASGSSVIDVTGYGINKGQVASNANWELAYKRAFTDFMKNLDIALDSKGL
ncbi:MAG: YajG family lipoprotein [Pseudomonadales bacterium]